jgi:hypothetical protein
MLTKEQIEAFLTELTELSRKYGITIGGCGCCGSPSLDELSEKEKNGKYVYSDNIGWSNYHENHT